MSAEVSLRREPVVAVVGATGAVGVEIVQCLERRRFPLSELRPLASARSAGKTQAFAGQVISVREFTVGSLAGVDLALFSAGSAISKRYAPVARARGAVVVDSSSVFRMDDDVPLVIPEINPEALAQHRGIIANPNCAAIIAITPAIISTYQAASGAGAAAMEELRESTRAALEGRDYEPKVLPHRYASICSAITPG